MLATLYFYAPSARIRVVVKLKALPPLSELNKLVVVLVRPRNPLNIGAAARAMTNFGASDLRVVNPYDIAFREARSAVGAAALLKNAEGIHDCC